MTSNFIASTLKCQVLTHEKGARVTCGTSRVSLAGPNRQYFTKVFSHFEALNRPSSACQMTLYSNTPFREPLDLLHTDYSFTSAVHKRTDPALVEVDYMFLAVPTHFRSRPLVDAQQIRSTFNIG